MLENRVHDSTIPLLSPEMFYKEEHSIVFQAIKDLYNNREAIDLLTVSQKLKRDGNLDLVGGTYQITNLTARVASSSNIEYHVAILRQMWLKRALIAKSHETINQAYDDTSDVFELMGQFDAFLADSKRVLIGADHEISYAQVVEKTYLQIVERTDKGFTGIDSGSDKLNGITGGWQNTDLIFICARPGQGKTTRMLSFAKSAANMGRKVAIFSLEMSSAQLIKKQLSDFSGVYGDKILTSTLNDKFDIPKLRLAADSLKKLPIYLNDRPAVKPSYIRAVCRERKKNFGLDMVFVDYLTLMRPDVDRKNASKNDWVGEVAAAMKALAKELEIPIMVACQLNRETDKRADKRPILSDLRDSGEIEQHADIVISPYRPSYYAGRDADYQGMDDEQYSRISELIVMKNRNGKANVKYQEMFYGELSKFVTEEQQQF